MITVLATREGLIGGKTSSGYRVESMVPFIALPSTAALRLWVKLHNPLNHKVCRALVLDVGPWNEKDHPYVFQDLTLNRYGIPLTNLPSGQKGGMGGVRPQAEAGTDSFGRVTNKAGIDLSEAVWDLLGMKDNSYISWEFE